MVCPVFHDAPTTIMREVRPMGSFGNTSAVKGGVAGTSRSAAAGLAPASTAIPGSLGVSAGPSGPPVPTNIYEIEPKTGLAVMLYEHEVKGRYAGSGNLTLILSGTQYFILRRGVLSKTERATIDAINNPSKADPLVGFAVRLMQTDAVKSGGVFPVGYYVGFSKAVILEAIRMHKAKPDKGVELAGTRFGSEVADSGGVHPAFHVYESIARVDDDNGFDKVQHFTRSAVMQFMHGKDVTDLAQYAKEFRDEVKSWTGGEKGYDKADMLANNRGQKFGEELHKKHHPIRNKLRIR
jgi:hypothetical protein